MQKVTAESSMWRKRNPAKQQGSPASTVLRDCLVEVEVGGTVTVGEASVEKRSIAALRPKSTPGEGTIRAWHLASWQIWKSSF